MLISYFALLAILATGCLAANTRVLNGTPAKPHQFPYHVGIYAKQIMYPNAKPVYHFGGAVVSDRWVLTTAEIKYHVDKDAQLFVKAGKHIVYQDEASEQTRLVVRYIIHPEYKQASFISENLIAQNDIALLQVDSPFVFNEYVGAAVIPSANAYYKYGALAGWGLTGTGSYDPIYPEELHYDHFLTVMNTKDCADAINAVVSVTSSLSVEISNNQTCSRKWGRKYGACLKDEGSAFVSQEDDEYVIIGIVSMNYLPCGDIERPTVYTRVSAHSKWINKIIKS